MFKCETLNFKLFLPIIFSYEKCTAWYKFVLIEYRLQKMSN